ncbi:MAG: alpha-mannosidase [Ruminococcaceae bacterium]|nr:alpha-mannosidase [Oscillospiraceae bacterium]
MTVFNKINKLKSKANRSAYTERILSELEFSAELSAMKNNVYDEIIHKSADVLAQALETEGALTNKVCMEAEQILMGISEDAKSYTVHCVGHAHIDMNWMWGYQETAALTVDTFRTVLDLMKEYPEFTFGQSQASTFKIIEDYAPEMLDEIKKYVKEGRFEITASTWVETDKNMPSGESLARHILYTKRYLSRLLDIDGDGLNLDFEPDTFGHNISVPEICSKGGVKYYYHCRGNIENPKNPAYVWRARNGSELLVWRDPLWYNGSVSSDAFFKLPELCERNGIKDFLFVYGVGDHGGGPTRRDINKIIEISQWPIMPNVKFSTYSAFFKALETVRESLPVRQGELNFLFTGCYTSQAKIKMSNRIAEDRMYESEMLAALAYDRAGAPKKNESFEGAWRKILFNHFHDILPGSGVAETREYALGEFQSAMAAISTNANLSMRYMAQAIDTSKLASDMDPLSVSEGAGVGFMTDQQRHFRMPVAERGNGKKRIFHLFNTTGFDFDGVCEIIVWDWNYASSRAVFKDSKGNRCRYKLMEDSNGYWDHQFKKFAIEARIDAFGYATYTLDEEEITDVGGYSLIYTRLDGITDTDIVMENNKIKVIFDRSTMKIKSMINKENGVENVDEPTGFFRFIKENPRHGMTSWRIGEYMTAEDLNTTRDVKITQINLGGIRQSISFEMSAGERSSIKVKIELDENSEVMVYDVTVDFHEIGKKGQYVPQLTFALPIGYKTDLFKYDVPYGIIDRKGICHDVPANSFAAAVRDDESEKGAVMLISDSKYGFRCHDNYMAMTLIRASYDPDPYPEYGIHNIKIGVGVINDTDGKTLIKARDFFVHPVSMCSSRGEKGKLSLEGSLVKITGKVIPAYVKLPEDDDGMIIRLYEADGKEADYSLEFDREIVSAAEIGINENTVGDVKYTQNKAYGTVEGYSVKNILVKLKKN